MSKRQGEKMNLKEEISSLKERYPGANYIEIDAEPSDYRWKDNYVYMIVGSKNETLAEVDIEEFANEYPALYGKYGDHERKIERIIVDNDHADVDFQYSI